MKIDGKCYHNRLCDMTIFLGFLDEYSLRKQYSEDYRARAAKLGTRNQEIAGSRRRI